MLGCSLNRMREETSSEAISFLTNIPLLIGVDHWHVHRLRVISSHGTDRSIRRFLFAGMRHLFFSFTAFLTWISENCRPTSIWVGKWRLRRRNTECYESWLHLSFDSYHGIKLSFSTWHDYLWWQYDETSDLIHNRHDTEQSDRLCVCVRPD